MTTGKHKTIITKILIYKVLKIKLEIQKINKHHKAIIITEE